MRLVTWTSCHLKQNLRVVGEFLSKLGANAVAQLIGRLFTRSPSLTVHVDTRIHDEWISGVRHRVARLAVTNHPDAPTAKNVRVVFLGATPTHEDFRFPVPLQTTHTQDNPNGSRDIASGGEQLFDIVAENVDQYGPARWVVYAPTNLWQRSRSGQLKAGVTLSLRLEAENAPSQTLSVEISESNDLLEAFSNLKVVAPPARWKTLVPWLVAASVVAGLAYYYFRVRPTFEATCAWSRVPRGDERPLVAFECTITNSSGAEVKEATLTVPFLVSAALIDGHEASARLEGPHIWDTKPSPPTTIKLWPLRDGMSTRVMLTVAQTSHDGSCDPAGFQIAGAERAALSIKGCEVLRGGIGGSSPEPQSR